MGDGKQEFREIDNQSCDSLCLSILLSAKKDEAASMDG